jgi:hypothetical protein
MNTSVVIILILFNLATEVHWQAEPTLIMLMQVLIPLPLQVTPTTRACYCKQIMKAAYLRHLEGLKGVFRVNETECQYTIVLDEPRQVAIMIRSNMHEIVSQYQKAFDILWEKAVPVIG